MPLGLAFPPYYHLIPDAVFSVLIPATADEGRAWRIEFPCLTLGDAPETDPERLLHHLRVFTSLTVTARHLLALRMGAPVDVPADNILSFVLRVLALDDRQVVQDGKRSHVFLAASLSELQRPCVRLLAQLIATARGLVVRHTRCGAADGTFTICPSARSSPSWLTCPSALSIRPPMSAGI